MRLLTLILGTSRELAAKATLYVLAGISTVILLGVMASISSSTTAEGTTLLVFGNPVAPPAPLDMFNDVVYKMEAALASGLLFGVVLFGMFATAGVLPDALERGTVDLYLSKPIARWHLLLGKYLGGVLVILVNIVYFIGSLWLIIGVKVGVWNLNFLVAAFAMTFVFACLYSIVAFIGVLTRNMAIAIICGFVYLFIIAEVLQNREAGLFLLSDNFLYRGILDGLYTILPQIPAMRTSVLKFIGGDAMDWKVFVQGILSSAGILGFSAWTLMKKDF